MTPPVPPDEVARLAALHSYQVLDTPAEERYDRLVELARQLTGAPVAAISLLDADRQWFKAVTGSDLVQTRREDAFCAHTVAQGAPLVVPDALADPRFAVNPLVTGAPHIRSYAGVPLVTGEGRSLGALCVLHTGRPGSITGAQLEGLRTLALQVVAQLELDRHSRLLAEAQRALAGQGQGSATRREAARLERALDDGELVVHYQPLWRVTADGGTLVARLTAAEALVRWQHPQRGLVLPGEFVPAMERHGLASRLGEVVLAEALTQVAAWEPRLPEGFRVNVNVASQQLHEGRTGELLDALVARTGARADRVCLEVTESALLDATSFTPQEAQRLRDRGLQLALDDFGTGFSSLTQLRSFPFSVVKVDRSFVSGLGRDEQDEVIVDTVVSLAHRLGLEPVAEGVETVEQLERVVATGCREVQGWLLGRSSSADQWDALLDAPVQVLLRSRRLGMVPVARDGNALAPAS